MTTSQRPRFAHYRLTGHSSAFREPAELDALHGMFAANLERVAVDAGGTGIADMTDLAVEDETPDHLAMRQEHEDQVAEDDGREPRTLTPLRYVRADARIVWP